MVHMRLKSSIFVSALIRRETGEGAFAAVLNKGAEDAGAIFVVHLRSISSSDIYGPVPQMFVGEENDGERLFERIAANVDAEATSGIIEKQIGFDPDCWVVEIEKPGEIKSLKIIQTGET